MEFGITTSLRKLYLKKTKIVLLTFFVLFYIQLTGQNKAKQDYIRITSAVFLENLMRNPPGNTYIITSEHVSSITNVKHTYIRQALNGIEVIGTESSVHIDRNGKTLMSHVNFVHSIESTVKNTSSTITAEQAIIEVARQMGYSLSNLIQLESLKGIHKKGLFNKAGISNRDIPIKSLYYYQDKIGTLLVWELSVKEKNTSDWWNFRVDASTGKIIDKDNWTISCDTPGNHSEEGHKEMARKKITKYPVDKTKLNLSTVASENTLLASSYKVFALPMESPYIGPRSYAIDPEDALASPIGWHDDGTTTYAYTKGNNVTAYDDGMNDDVGTEADHSPETSPGLIFDYPFDAIEGGGNPIYTATDQSEDAAITNLFYWNNVIHDISYNYGFTEEAGNFQESNFSLGGVGGDSVEAQAQDSADLAPTSFNRCNANFATCPDGIKSTMQMYICDGAMTPGHNDAVYDNLVIIHEYSHGISNRLIGGGANVSALVNAEQMGEGWSDFYGYMLTMDSSNFMDDRVVGNFLKDLGPFAPGIRPAPYSFDFMVNPFTYAAVGDPGISSPHGIGFIWATMLYDMTEALIATYGFDPDLYTGVGGNNIALKLVTEGLKFQKVLPGFVDGRDAILAADIALTGGTNECIIWSTFAMRGLGFSADQGSAFDRFDGIEAFDLPEATLIPSRTSLCISEGVVSGLSGGRLIGGFYSGTHVTDAGDGKTFSFDAATAGVGIHSISYGDPCTGTSAIATIEVIPTSVPIVVCKDVTITLDASGDASITELDVVANFPEGTGSLGYTIDETGSFAPETITGTEVTIAEDDGTPALSIGFDFSFFGTTYSEFYIASNGFVSFTGDGLSGPPSYSSTIIPKSEIPNGMIAMVWDELSPHISGTIKYETIGTEPTRKLIVSFESVPLYLSPEIVTTQLQIHEGTNIIEIHTTLAENNGGLRTQGIENADGTLGYAIESRNWMDWTATSDYVGFKPIKSGLPDNCGSPVIVSLSKTDFTCDDIGSNIITITADDGMGGIDTCTSTVTILGTITTWTGSWDSSPPTSSTKAIFNSSYSTSTANIDACSCEIGMAATVTVEAGDYMKINKNIIVETGSTLVVEHTGNMVQIDDTAIVTNDGIINVNITTPSLSAKDFLILGSPMSLEDDTAFVDMNGLGTAAYQVKNHTTEDFTPYEGDPAIIGVNFYDQEPDDWSNHLGALVIGEGYLVRPSNTDDGSYDYQFNIGTLNNGVVTYSAFFGDDKEDSPNVLSNPYASAIDADSLISSNEIVDEIYFWEHNTTPAAGIPGPLTANFNMEDISTRNLGMGIPAATGGSTPDGVISTGQGFGIKANATGDVTFNNALRLTSGNTTLRQNEEKNLIWIEVREKEYGLGSITGIAFTSNATQDLDKGYDTMKLGTVVSLYTHLLDGSQQLGIQGREDFDINMLIPMGFSTLIQSNSMISYNISISNIEGTSIEQASVYLIDNLTNTITNLSIGSYEFLSDAGTFDNRFTIQFEEQVLETNDLKLESVFIYPNPSRNILNIVSPRLVVSSVELFDLSGRIVKKQTFTEHNNYQIDISVLESAIYFIQITTDNGIITKRMLKE